MRGKAAFAGGIYHQNRLILIITQIQRITLQGGNFVVIEIWQAALVILANNPKLKVATIFATAYFIFFNFQILTTQILATLNFNAWLELNG